ncbi:MAG: hypothetical protein EOM69_07400 [Clostridia bacterium]|nr:hypothetical protein [Clostridia bacterium]
MQPQEQNRYEDFMVEPKAPSMPPQEPLDHVLAALRAFPLFVKALLSEPQTTLQTALSRQDGVSGLTLFALSTLATLLAGVSIGFGRVALLWLLYVISFGGVLMTALCVVWQRRFSVPLLTTVMGVSALPFLLGSVPAFVAGLVSARFGALILLGCMVLSLSYGQMISDTLAPCGEERWTVRRLALPLGVVLLWGVLGLLLC